MLYVSLIVLISLVKLIIQTNFILYQIANLLGSHPDLKEQCEDFIAYVEKTGEKLLIL